MKPALRLFAGLFTALVLHAAGEWSDPVEVRHDDQLCIAYRTRWTGEYLVVEASVQPGWHTFAMDNKQRQQEKLAGKQSLGVEKSTEITVTGGLAATGPWLQSSPKDFSKPDLLWFTWGFDQHALFAVKARRSSPAAAAVAVRGQACSDSVCKNIEVSLPVPSPSSSPALEMKSLVAVRQP